MTAKINVKMRLKHIGKHEISLNVYKIRPKMGEKGIGHVSGYFLPNKKFYLQSAWIAEKYRNKKIGQEAVAKLEKYLKKRGIEEVWVWDGSTTEYWTKRGFKVKKMPRETVDGILNRAFRPDYASNKNIKVKELVGDLE